ncbi:MAG: SDR family NAD(P)-dependent oxidoreductase [Nevskiaceae bacterium]|nr:MAG: SDR family NAD(P)-dependent oxidoreductase [Nevskiaceae bacterium]TBR73695.1 MAG: SDR family NAD(P)-dependent oxidoreductase [Nevskiaceae bacterium]
METHYAVVTGAAGGLGLGIATRLLGLGWDVALLDVNEPALARAQTDLQTAFPGAVVNRLAVDLAQPASIRAAGAALAGGARPIDALVNNAGIYPPSQRTLSAEGQELSFAIGHLGHFRLTHVLWPLLEAAPAARVVSISSLIQRYARLYFDDLTLARRYTPVTAYRQTKLACLLFALELHQRLEKAGSRIASYAAHPGVCRTGIGRNRRVAATDSAWQRVATWVLGFGLDHFGQTPAEGAEPAALASSSGRFPPGSFVGPTGFLDMAGPVGLVRLGRVAQQPKAATRLWAQTEALTGLRWPL